MPLNGWQKEQENLYCKLLSRLQIKDYDSSRKKLGSETGKKMNIKISTETNQNRDGDQYRDRSVQKQINTETDRDKDKSEQGG